MLKYLLCFLFTVLLCDSANAQTDSTLANRNDTATLMTTGSTQANESDDDFNIFLMVFAVGFLGAVMADAFVVFLFLSVAALSTIAGVISASVLIGLYKRSLQAGFKSLLLIAS